MVLPRIEIEGPAVEMSAVFENPYSEETSLDQTTSSQVAFHPNNDDSQLRSPSSDEEDEAGGKEKKSSPDDKKKLGNYWRSVEEQNGVSELKHRSRTKSSMGITDSDEEASDTNTDGKANSLYVPSSIRYSMHIQHMQRKQSKTALPDWDKKARRNIVFGGYSLEDRPENHMCSKLYHTKRKVLSLKNYHDEARAMRDIEKFLAHPVVLFKVHHTLWEDIVEEMICKLCSDKPELNLNVTAAMSSIISNEADYVLPECIQGITETAMGPVTEQSFIVVIGTTDSVQDNQVVMCLLEQPFNFGKMAEEIRFICIVLGPHKTKHTKSAIQVARTYATLLADDRLRHNLLNTHSPEEFAHEFELECTRIHKEHERREKLATISIKSKQDDKKNQWLPGKDMFNDFKNRLRWYPSDYLKDIQDCTSIQKIISTILFLYFSLLLPGISMGVLDAKYTGGRIDSKSVIIAQAFSGILWGLFGGQPLMVIMTTIPIVIYTKIIYIISLNWDENGDFFYTFYMMVGLANAFFMVIYAVLGASKIMAYCSRSTEEIVGMFVSTAFVYDSVKYIINEFNTQFCFPEDMEGVANVTKRAAEELAVECDPNKPLVSLIVVLITVYVGVQIFNFKYSPYLNANKRVIVADYALVIAVAAGSFVGSFFFRKIELNKFTVDEDKALFEIPDYVSPTGVSVIAAVGLGFMMSILFFMETNISESIVSNPANKLEKGTSFHMDLFVTGIINAILSIFCLPWVHGGLPHSPLHVRALADIEEHVENGHLTENVVYVRETRITTLVSHILIGLSVMLIPKPINMIPEAVFYGLFIFLAITALGEFQMWERFVLIFTEQTLYPPFHYVRKVPQKIIHCFTLLQLLQLVLLCVVSFAGSAYLKMFFPFVIILLMPIREKVLPTLISDRHLDALDGNH